MEHGYKAPDVPDSQITPGFVRDELLKCFESANAEFAEARNQPVTEDQLRQQVRVFVEGVFSQCGVSYVAPTKEGIVTAIAECRRNAEQEMGKPAEKIINHHYAEMMKLVDRL